MRNFIGHKQPDMDICGLIHEARGVDTIGKTQMINCGTAVRYMYARIHFAEIVIAELCG